MVLRNTTPDREKDKFDLNSQGETAVRTIPDFEAIAEGLDASQLILENPFINHVPMAVANTEYSFALQTGVKALWIRALKVCELKIYWASGATEYQRIGVGGYYHRQNLNLTGATVYLQSSIANNTAIVEQWT